MPLDITSASEPTSDLELERTEDDAFNGCAADEVGIVLNGDGASPPPVEEPKRAKPIFIGHGGRKGPLEKLIKLLNGFKIPHLVAIDEPNLGRPIPQEVRELMLQCGSAILIFTKDQQFFDAEKNEVWRPSENVGHELGAASFAYEDRIVIFKEKGISLPSNYSSVGHIEFVEDHIEAKTADLLKELIGFGLVTLTPAA